MIFAYHRVLREHDSLVPGLPTAERFERQLQWIRRFCNPLPLAEAVQRLRAGTLPARALSVTFDDGYADNLEVATPLLRKYQIPAVVFVTVDAVERGFMWNDLLIEAVRAAQGEIDASEVGLGRLPVDDANRLEVFRRLTASVKYRPIAERLRLSEILYVNACRDVMPRQMLRPDQLKELLGAGIDIGAHTVNHPILTLLDDSEARAEIENSRTWIAGQTGRVPRLFAYPNGRRNDDYDSRHAEIVRSLGFEAAVSTNWGCATRRSSLYELPRFKPWEDNATGFCSRLCKVVLRSYFPHPSRE